MAQNTKILVPANTATLLTDSAVTALTFTVEGQFPVQLQGRAGTGAITTWGPTYDSGQGELNIAIADLFPGVSGVDRVYALAFSPTVVWVSHA